MGFSRTRECRLDGSTVVKFVFGWHILKSWQNGLDSYA